jgi:hypothetical protein
MFRVSMHLDRGPAELIKLKEAPKGLPSLLPDEVKAVISYGDHVEIFGPTESAVQAAVTKWRLPLNGSR